MAEERIIHFHKYNAINVWEFSGPTPHNRRIFRLFGPELSRAN